jgi:MFS family permease
LIEGISNGAASVVGGISGRVSDKLASRKRVAFVGYALTATSRPLIAFAQAWPVVLGARFADRFGKGIRGAPRDALLAETADEKHRGRAFGFERAMDSSGAVIGPLAGLALLGLLGPGNLRTIFMISCIPAAVAALLILAVHERRSEIVTGQKSLRLSLKGTTREYRKFLLIVAVFGLANSANAFLILRAEGLGLSTSWTIMAYTLYNAVAALASMPAGAASDRVGRRNLLIAGYTVYAIVYAGFGLADAAWLMWPLFAMYGLFPALTEGAAKALAVDTAGEAGHGTAIGVYVTVTGLTQIAASYIGGMLWDAAGARSTFYFGAALSALAAVLLLALMPARYSGARG